MILFFFFFTNLITKNFIYVTERDNGNSEIYFLFDDGELILKPRIIFLFESQGIENKNIKCPIPLNEESEYYKDNKLVLFPLDQDYLYDLLTKNKRFLRAFSEHYDCYILSENFPDTVKLYKAVGKIDFSKFYYLKIIESLTEDSGMIKWIDCANFNIKKDTMLEINLSDKKTEDLAPRFLYYEYIENYYLFEFIKFNIVETQRFDHQKIKKNKNFEIIYEDVTETCNEKIEPKKKSNNRIIIISMLVLLVSVFLFFLIKLAVY